MLILILMKFILIILIFFVAFFPVYINVSAFAAKADLGAKEDLKTYDISFLIKADLNNDGREEKATIYRQWNGEGWRSDDVWYVTCIFDEEYNIVYKSDISHFQEVKSLSARDRGGDGLKEIIVSPNVNNYWKEKTCTYGWRGNGHGVVSKQ